MAYKKIGFKDRIDNKPTTYLVDGKSTEIIKDDTDVEEEGTNLNATNLNHMEDGILQNSRDIEVLNKQIINIKVPVESVNGKTGNIELKAEDIKCKDGTTLERFKETNNQEITTLKESTKNNKSEIDNLKSCVDNGKNSLYSAIVDKKVTPRSKDFNDLAKGIREIKLGQGNAQTNDVLEGKTFTNAEGNLLTGNMKNYGSKIITPSKEIQTLNKGYYDSVKVNPIDKDVLQSNFNTLELINILKELGINYIIEGEIKPTEMSNTKNEYNINVGFEPRILIVSSKLNCSYFWGNGIWYDCVKSNFINFDKINIPTPRTNKPYDALQYINLTITNQGFKIYFKDIAEQQIKLGYECYFKYIAVY